MENELCFNCGESKDYIDALKLCQKCFDKKESFPTHSNVYQCKLCQRYKNANLNMICGNDLKILKDLLFKLIDKINRYDVIDYNLIDTGDRDYLTLEIIYKKLIQDYNPYCSDPDANVKITKYVRFDILQMQDCDQCNKNDNLKYISEVVFKYLGIFKLPLLILEQKILIYDRRVDIIRIINKTNQSHIVFNNKDKARHFINFICNNLFVDASKAKIAHKNLQNDIFYLNMAPIEPFDICVLKKEVSNKFGHIGQICVVERITDLMYLVNPFNGKKVTINNLQYFKNPFDSIIKQTQLNEYWLISKEEKNGASSSSSFGTIQIMRPDNPQDEYYTTTQLYSQIHENEVGDDNIILLGYNLNNWNGNDILDDIKLTLPESNMIVIVKIISKSNKENVKKRLIPHLEGNLAVPVDKEDIEQFNIMLDEDEILRNYLHL